MNQELYNTRYLAKPPTSCLRLPQHADTAVFEQIRCKLRNCINVLSTSADLSTENRVLKRLLYKKKNQIRRQKVFQSLLQVPKFIERFTEANLDGYATELLSSFKDDCCPARQMVEYFLVRFMGVAVLLAETNNYCMKTFLELYQHLETGHLVPQNLIFLGAVSRIRWIACALYLHVVDWYDSVVGTLSQFPPSPHAWLPNGHQFPPHLHVWVNSKSAAPVGALHLESSLEEEKSLIAGMVGKFSKESLHEEAEASFGEEGTPSQSSHESYFEEAVDEHTEEGSFERSLEQCKIDVDMQADFTDFPAEAVSSGAVRTGKKKKKLKQKLQKREEELTRLKENQNGGRDGGTEVDGDVSASWSKPGEKRKNRKRKLQPREEKLATPKENQTEARNSGVVVDGDISASWSKPNEKKKNRKRKLQEREEKLATPKENQTEARNSGVEVDGDISASWSKPGEKRKNRKRKLQEREEKLVWLKENQTEARNSGVEMDGVSASWSKPSKKKTLKQKLQRREEKLVRLKEKRRKAKDSGVEMGGDISSSWSKPGKKKKRMLRLKNSLASLDSSGAVDSLIEVSGTRRKKQGKEKELQVSNMNDLDQSSPSSRKNLGKSKKLNINKQRKKLQKQKCSVDVADSNTTFTVISGASGSVDEIPVKKRKRESSVDGLNQNSVPFKANNGKKKMRLKDKKKKNKSRYSMDQSLPSLREGGGKTTNLKRKANTDVLEPRNKKMKTKP